MRVTNSDRVVERLKATLRAIKGVNTLTSRLNGTNEPAMRHLLGLLIGLVARRPGDTSNVIPVDAMITLQKLVPCAIGVALMALARMEVKSDGGMRGAVAPIWHTVVASGEKVKDACEMVMQCVTTTYIPLDNHEARSQLMVEIVCALRVSLDIGGTMHEVGSWEDWCAWALDGLEPSNTLQPSASVISRRAWIFPCFTARAVEEEVDDIVMTITRRRDA